MQVLCVIPARIGSTRLPEKPLQILGEEPLIRHTARRGLELAVAQRVVVATDDERVARAVSDLPVDVAVSDQPYTSGTERVAAVHRMAEFETYDMVLNLQGDEPFVPESAVRGALSRVSDGDAIGTAAATLSPRELEEPNVTKVWIDAGGYARDFSRQAPAPPAVTALRHIGVYAYRSSALERWVAAPPAVRERREGLEQLRPMSYGEVIGVTVLDEAAPPGIDTPRDLIAAANYLQESRTQVRV